jgi:hypothetical protein
MHVHLVETPQSKASAFRFQAIFISIAPVWSVEGRYAQARTVDTLARPRRRQAQRQYRP